MIDLNKILTERLAVVGGTGSGKSYTARGLVERVLAKTAGRVGIIDPTGVWWGLRLKPDGRSAGFPVVLFGGDHSDVPLIETAGRVIAQAVASTHQSWIIDTSALKSKAAERRFMLDFLDGIFEANREDIVLVVDEADRFSPQRMNPESARLHERMEEIVRRGRVRGFTPWLITQRPASLNKDVLSQATAYISMRMTGKHDREAMGDVIEGQADKQVAKAIVDSMPRHKVGQGLVWAPQQDILLPATFPAIKTFDSMQAPKPGERRKEKTLPPIDLGALREKMATVETEAKANDPKVLKAEIAKLKRQIEQMPALAVVDAAAEKPIYERGYGDGVKGAQSAIMGRMHDAGSRLTHLAGEMDALKRALEIPLAEPKKFPAPDTRHTRGPALPPPAAPHRRSPVAPPPPRRNGQATPVEGITRPQQRILDTLGMLEGIGIPVPTKTQLAVWCDVSPTSGGYFNNLGALKSAGLIDYPAGGSVSLADPGRAVAQPSAPPTTQEMQDALCAKVGNAKAAILRALIEIYPETINKDELASKIGVSPTSGGYFNNLGSLRTLGVIDYPQPGYAVALPILFVA